RSFFSIPKTKGPSPQAYTLKKKLNHPQALMYEIVADVSKYNEFVPYCTESFINEKNARNQPTEAGLRVGWKQFDERFVCKLTCQENTQVIAESLSHSLFSKLYTEWNIRDLPNRHNACEAEITLEYEFKNPLYNSVSSLFASKVADLMVKAFEQRAVDLK
ncbi:hypothetical protein BABINDRAFT_28246, partial [Babjeviella inositovora NRRL Y-12698]